VTNLAAALLRPCHVALLGASDDVSKTAARPLMYLRRAGFQGTVYPINANRAVVAGERAWPSLASLPVCPDHVLVLTPTDAAIEALQDCAKLGVPVATVLASGFSEAGPQGLLREARVRDICACSALRVVGPSSLGIINMRHRMPLTANAAFAEPDLPVGRLFAASHSGSLIGALATRGKARGVGFAGLVSVGNETNVSIGEVCAATLDDPEIDGYVLFLESIRHAQSLREFALGAAARRKPVIAYKLGRSPEGSELALSHTGALAGEDDVADAFFADCGIARVDTFDGLLEAPLLAQRLAIRGQGARRPAVGVVTTTGGGAAMLVDQLALRGVATVGPSATTLAALEAADVSVAPARIVDLTLAGTRYDTMKAALDVLSSAPEFDLLVAVVGSSARLQPELAVRPVIDSAGTSNPVAVFIVPDAPDASAQLTAAGIPNFRSPETGADVVHAVLARQFRNAPRRLPTGPWEAAIILDELSAYDLFDLIGIPHAPAVALCFTEPSRALPFPYPVAVKLLSDAVTHKSDIGGVMLGVNTECELAAAIRQVVTAAENQRPGLKLEQVLVQTMVRGLSEALVGYRLDPEVGPIVILAAGGIATEVYRDRSVRLAPVDFAMAQTMIAEVRGFNILSGYRGSPKGDLDALARAIVAFSQLSAVTDPHVLEAEINPLLVLRDGEGVVAVDALVRLGHSATGRMAPSD
jgi:acyl-CoA synthetase (NDP forming)